LFELPWEEINQSFQSIYNTDYQLTPKEAADNFGGEVPRYLKDTALRLMKERLRSYDEHQVRLTMREVLLATFDSFWKDHLLSMDHLKEGINLRSYGQKDPLVEYKREAFAIYEDMKSALKRTVLERFSHIRMYTEAEIEEIKRQQQAELDRQLEAHRRSQEAFAQAQNPQQAARPQRGTVKVGRNDPCPCGSGKKFKSCHGA
jgi:preprotein translocase subunit SecA